MVELYYPRNVPRAKSKVPQNILKMYMSFDLDLLHFTSIGDIKCDLSAFHLHITYQFSFLAPLNLNLIPL